MGKRIEKAFGRDKGQSSSTSQDNADDDPNKTPEPYVCTGMFYDDFAELCRRDHMTVIPPVVLRPHRPPSPSTVQPVDDNKASKKDKKDDKKNQPPPEPEPEPELDENGEPPEPPPKTYTVKDKFEYFKPCVQVEMDNHDKQDTVTEIYVRGWKVDVAMMNIFKQCLPRLDRLQAITLWNAGLTEETLEMLASLLSECPNIKTLTLDNNVVKEEGWDILLKDECPVQHLSLRYNKISDKGATLLGKALGNATHQNQRLLSLNLNGNQISDTGATALADGLRMNRTLLSLSLGNNKIGNPGAQKFAEVLSRFQLTHEEIVERRKLLSEKGSPERQKSPSSGSRRADSRDRPGSVRSSHAGTTKGGKSAKAKKDTKKEDDKKAKQKDLGASVAKKGPTASIVADMGKAPKKGEKVKGKGKGSTTTDMEGLNEVQETQEMVNPLLDSVERLEGGIIMLAGNRTLINLNLPSNKISEEGIKALLLAIGYQTSLSQFHSGKPGNTGLMRLVLHRNLVKSDNEQLQKLNTMMTTKDPFYKAPAVTPDLESVQS